jgi:hypothetical protein
LAIDHKTIIKFLENPNNENNTGFDEKFQKYLISVKRNIELKIQIEIEKLREQSRLNNPKYFDLDFLKETSNEHDLSYIDSNYENISKRIKENNKKLKDIDL